jgi:hypothetical protein
MAIAKNYEDFTEIVLNGIINGLNNTERGQEITKKLLAQKLTENPNLTVKEWKEIQSKALTSFFLLSVTEIPELKEEFKRHCFDKINGASSPIDERRNTK